MRVAQKTITYFLSLFTCLWVSAQNTPIHKDLLYFHSDYYGKLDSTFTSERNAAPIFSLDSSYQELIDDLKIKGLKKWYWDRIFNKSWFIIKEKNWALTIDPYVNVSLGSETTLNNNTWFKKTGLYLNSTIGNKLSIHSYFYEYVIHPESYLTKYVNYNGIMPGEGESKINQNTYSNYFSAGGINYKANQFLDLSFAHGKIFLGDGYRSILLSDNAAAFPYGRLNLRLGKKINYTAIVAEFIEKKTSDVGSGNTLRQKKYTSFHYLNIRLHKKLFLALSETVIWGGDTTGRNNLEINYLNPFVVIRPQEYNLGSMDKIQLGTSIKYLPFNFSTLYGQFLLTEYYAKELFGGNNWWGNKYAFQVGGKFHNFPFAKNLYLQLEYNQIRPFTYAHRNTITSYSHLGQPLAHPSGSNLKESIVILNYRVKRWNFNWRSIYRISGLENSDTSSIGTDVQRSYELRESEYGNVIGQGISYNQWFNSLTASFLINPANMMFLEAGITNRQEKTAGVYNQTNYIYLGVRTGILNNYYDF